MLTSAYLSVGNSPRFIYTTFGNPVYIYVTNFGSDTVSVIDPTTNTVIENITVGDWSHPFY